MPSRLEELTERARRTLARAGVGDIGGNDGVAALPPDGIMPAKPAPVPPDVPLDNSQSGGEIILGVDPGTATTGYGVIRVRPDAETTEGGLGTVETLTYGVIQTPPDEPMPERLLSLYRGLREIVQTYHPREAAVEQLFFGRNVTTAVTVGQARGVALLAIAEAGMHLFEYKPAEVKQTVTGFGRADKRQMQRMVQTLLSLDSIPHPDDAADALAVALCHFRFARVRALGFRS